MSHPLDDALGGLVVEAWIARTAERGVAIVRDGALRLLASFPGGEPTGEVAPGEGGPWDLPLIATRGRGPAWHALEALPDGVPATTLPPPAADGLLPPFVRDVAARMAGEHAAGRAVGVLHPALVFVDAAGALTGISRRLLKCGPPAPYEGWTPLFATRYATPADLDGRPPTSADDVFRLAAMTWRWRHGTPPFGSGIDELAGIRAGRPLDPGDGLDRLLARALDADEAVRPAAADLLEALLATP